MEAYKLYETLRTIAKNLTDLLERDKGMKKVKNSDRCFLYIGVLLNLETDKT